MSSPTQRRPTLTSSTQLQPSLHRTHRGGQDAAASICAHLIVHNGLSRVRIAHAVGLPALVIEESIKNGVSSAALRAQLRNWLFEAASHKLRVPDALFAQLQEECAADELERQTNQRKGIVSSMGSDGSSFSALDPVSQAHFTTLQRSVGQSFVSILNDPGEPTTNVDWSTWLGGKLYEAFDFNGRVGSLEDVLRTFRERQAGPESAAGLLAEYPPNQDFSAYVKLISEAYQANRREGIANDAEEWRDDRGDGGIGGRGAMASAAENGGGGPWPHGVPDLFFDADFDLSVELARLSEMVGESMPAQSAPPAEASAQLAPVSAASASGGGSGAVSAAASPPSSKRVSDAGHSRSSIASASPPAARPAATAMPSLSYIVDNTTFTDDFEYLEGRNKELRAWESAVEKCLLQHVKHRSEDFFATSQQFGSLSGDARSVLDDAKLAREGGMRAAEHFVAEYLRIGQLYRRRQNFALLQRTATTAQRLLRRLSDIENWAALPERDFSEVMAIASALVDLETASKNDDDSASSISWHTLSRLHCLAEVPARVRLARKALEKVVLEEYVAALLSDLSDGDAAGRIRLVCAGVTRLGVLNAANQLYHVKAVEALQIAAQESLVGLLMNTGTLDDARANELLAVASNTVAFALPEARQQLCGFAKSLRFGAYQQVLQQFVDVLVDFVTRVSQSWGFCVTGGLRQSLALFDNAEAMVQQATRELFSRVCGEAESMVASMLEVYAGAEQLNTTAEVEHLVRISTNFPLRITSDVAGRLAALLDSGAGGSAGHGSDRRNKGDGGSNNSSSAATAAAAAGEPLGFSVYRPTRVIGTTIQRLAKRFFRRQHKFNRERITMVTEGETWAAKDTVDAAIQREVEDMCTLNTTALEKFRLGAVRVLMGAGETNSGVSGAVAYGRGGGSVPRAGSGAGHGGEDVLDTDATKLYLRLPRSSAAGVTPTSAATYAFTSSATSRPDGDDGDEAEEGRLVANSLLVLMDLLHQYHAFLAAFPFLAFDVASRMVELIDAYEGQTAAMVLGARAVEKKTLSTITTQHLCVASQCVSFLKDFIPALQAHLTAAMSGAVADAAQAHRAPRDVVAVACALGLIPGQLSPVVAAAGGEAEGGGSAPQTAAEASGEKAKLFVENDWTRVVKNCRAHRNEFFSKMGSLVYRKVEGLGSVSVQKNQWSAGGNEWVMAMLREVARLMRALRPLLPPADMDGVIVPLIGTLSVMLREATVRIPQSAVDDRAAATSDMMLFKANVEKFGYDVLLCARATSVSVVMQGGQSYGPVSTEEAVLAWFLPAAPPPAPQRSAATAK